MSESTLTVFDSTVQTTNAWLADLMLRMGWNDRHRAYYALRGVLHALRDRLPVDEVAGLSAQLPMLVRGFYYEGWHPAGKPLKERTQADFLNHVGCQLKDHPEINPERVTRAVFQIVAQHVTPGEVESVKQILPPEIRSLWS